MLAVAAGCFSEPTASDGVGSTGASSGDDAATTSSSSGLSTADGDATGSSGSVEPGSTSSMDAESSSGAASSSTTGSCEAREPPKLMWAEDATLVPPMELVPAVLLPDTPMLARSYAGDAGTIVFDFDLPCAATVEIHALVWDAISGVQPPDDPDSYFVSVDRQREEIWTYGCATGRVRDGTWLWQRVAGTTRAACDGDTLTFDLEAGPHELALRNRESGGDFVYAGIAAVVITDDPTFDPETLYEPAG